MGRVVERTEAQDILDRARAAGRSGAVAAARRLTDPQANPERDTNEFELMMNIEPGEAVTIYLTYQEVLYRKLDFSKYFVHVPSEEAFPDFDLGIVISDRRKIGILQIPDPEPALNARSISQLQLLDGDTQEVFVEPDVNDYDPDPVADGPGDYRLITWAGRRRPTEDVDLVVLYDLEYPDSRSGFDSEIIQTVDGFFVHFITPTRETRGDQDIIFVLDKSGSMRAKPDPAAPTKFEQVKVSLPLSPLLSLELGECGPFCSERCSRSCATWPPPSRAAAATATASTSCSSPRRRSGSGATGSGRPPTPATSTPPSASSKPPRPRGGPISRYHSNLGPRNWYNELVLTGRPVGGN